MNCIFYLTYSKVTQVGIFNAKNSFVDTKPLLPPYFCKNEQSYINT